MMRRLPVALALSALAGCATCPEEVLEAAVVVEARFSSDGMPVDDASIECVYGGVGRPGDDTQSSTGQYVCYGEAGQYEVRLTRSGITTGRIVDVPARDSCGPLTQTVELTVFGP